MDRIDAFMEQYDFTGKMIIPFATSGGSQLGDSAKNMQVLTKGATVMEGKRFAARASEKELADWATKYI